MSYSARQNLMIRAYLAIAAKVGPWSKDAGSEGAGYLAPPNNNAKAAGFTCQNCAFFRPQNGCVLVKGTIERDGVCRLHVIPQERLVRPQSVVGMARRGRVQGETVE
jgi:hypothetical protein